MSKKRYLSIFAFLFAVLFAFALGFGLSACGKDKDEDDDDDKGSTTPTHTHSYVLDEDADWEWSDDFSTYTHAATCTNEDGLCDAVNGVISADVTHDTTEATCLVDGEIVHTAKYNGDTLDTQKETIKAVGQHDITTTWTWDTTTDTPTAKLTFACSKGDLDVQTVTATVTYNEETDTWDATYTATDGTTVYEDSIDAGLAQPVYTYTVEITTTTTSYSEGDEEQLGATVYLGDEPTSETVTWSVEAVPEGCVTVDTNGLLKAVTAGTAKVTATYAYDGGTATDTLDITVTAKSENPDNPEETGVFQYFVDQLNVEKGTKTGGKDANEKAVAIEENDYFTITSPDVEVEYNDGSSSTSGMAATGKEPSATIADGTTRTFSLGLKQSEATKMDGSSRTPAFVVTANQDITLYLYVGLVNDSHNADKPGTIYYGVNGDQIGSQCQSSRQSVVTITVGLTEGDVLTVYAVPDNKTTTKKDDEGNEQTVQDTAKMWLYGAEAVYTVGAEGVTLDPATLALDLNGTTTGTITATIANSDYSYTWTGNEWSSSDESVATVSANGNTATVTAVEVGTATITVRLSDTISATCEVTVTNSSPTEPETTYIVTVTGAETVRVDEQITLTATVKTEDGTPVENPTITWSVSSETSSYAIVENDTGIVTGEARGSAYIIATFVDGSGNVLATGGKWISVQAASAQVEEGEEYSVGIDFSDASDLTVGTTATTGLDEGDIFTYVDIDLEGSIGDGALKTESFTKCGTSDYTNYILMDTSLFEGYSFELQITFTAETTNTTMAVVNALVENDGGYGQSSSIFGDTAPDLSQEPYAATYAGSETTLTYSGTVSDATDTLYIVWDGAVLISSISLELWTGERVNKLPSDVYEISVDLTDGASEEGSQGGSLDEYGFIELVDLTGQTDFKEGYFSTAYNDYSTGYTYTFAGGGDDEPALTNYIVINLAGHEYASITLMVGEGSSAGIVAIDSMAEQVKDNENSSTIIASSASSTGLLAWAGEVAEYGDQLFIVYSADIKIYSITLKFDDKAKENATTTADYTIEIDNQNVELYVNGNGAILVAKVTYNGQEIPGATISWSSENESVLKVDANGIATAVEADTTTSVKVTATYTDPSGETHTAEIAVTVSPDPNGEEEDDGSIKVSIDFTDAANTNLMSKLGTSKQIARDVYLDDNYILEYVVTDAAASYSYGWDTSAGALVTGTDSENGLTRSAGGTPSNYFAINLAGVDATYMELEVTFSSRYDYSAEHNSSFLELTSVLHSFFTGTYSHSSNPVDANAIKYVTTSDGQVTFTWEGDITSYNTLYLVYTTSLNIYSINIKLTGGEKSEGDEQKTMVAAKDTVDFTDEATRSSVALTAGETISITDIISLHVGDGSIYETVNDEYALYMVVVGEYSSNMTSSSGTYFIIDATGLQGQTITVTVTWCGKLASGVYAYDTDLAIGTTMDWNTSSASGDTLAYATYDRTAVTTSTFTFTVPKDATELYLYQPGRHYAGYIYSVTVGYEKKAGDAEAGSYSVEIDANGKETTLVVGGEGLTITARVYKNGVEDGTLTVTWTSTDPGAATVADGVVTAVAQGETDIYATFTWDGGSIDSGAIHITVIEAGSGDSGDLGEGTAIVEIDFSVSGTFNSAFVKNGYPTGETAVDDSGYVKWIDNYMSGDGVGEDGYFGTCFDGETGTNRNYSTVEPCFVIDLSGYEGYTVAIDVVYKQYSAEGAIIALDDEREVYTSGSSTILAEGTSTDTDQHLTWTGVVGTDTADGNLYLIFSAAVKIASITITVY